MRNIVIILACSFLVGCTTIKTGLNLKEHDPALALAYVDTKISFDDAYCDEYETLEAALYQSIWMHEYTIFVNDTQKTNLWHFLERNVDAISTFVDAHIIQYNEIGCRTSLKEIRMPPPPLKKST